MNHPRALAPVLSASLVLACTAPDVDDTTGSADSTGEPALPGPPVLDEPCTAELAAPTRLAITTTDNVTGALSILDLRTGAVTPDLALATSDSVPFHDGARLYLLHRYGFDALDVLTPDLGLLAQLGLGVPDVVSSNPHALAFAGDRAYVTMFGAPAVQIVDLTDPAAPTHAGSIDLTALADPDGNPEANLAIRCGDTLFITVQRLDENLGFAATGPHDHLAPIDLPSGRLHDLDPDAPGVQATPLLGPWAKQWRPDPADPAGHTLLVLSSGLERLDLTTLRSTWAVDPARLAAMGLVATDLTQAFDLDRTGAHAYIASYRADLSEVVLLRASLDDDAPIEEIAGGMQSIGPTLEVVDDTLWFGDRSHAAAGMRAWDLRTTPPTPRFDGLPISTGLAPYAAVPIP
ncbi:MAG TPA: hypothetical protein VGB85_16965 [Nannocystis sp.]|jgi:hypothetical protein